jgi:hypothetical protein
VKSSLFGYWHYLFTKTRNTNTQAGILDLARSCHSGVGSFYTYVPSNASLLCFLRSEFCSVHCTKFWVVEIIGVTRYLHFPDSEMNTTLEWGECPVQLSMHQHHCPVPNVPYFFRWWGGGGWSLVGLLKTLEWWSRSHLHLCCMNCDHCCWTLCCNHFYVFKKLHILWQANRCCADTRLEHGIWTGSGIKEPTRLAWPEAIPSMYQYLPSIKEPTRLAWPEAIPSMYQYLPGRY